MAGGASLFFASRPRAALLADINNDLMTFYMCLRDDTETLLTRLGRLRASRRAYYQVRSDVPRDRLERAVRFAYLNRLCWNGLYRVNQKGEFNVPIGSRLPTRMWDFDALRDAASALRDAALECRDFRTTFEQSQSGDFIFLDPPYPLGSGTLNGFDRYTPNRFTLEDHEHLANLADRATREGASVMVTLSAESNLSDYYPNHWKRLEIHGRSLISGTSDTRRSVTELLLMSYPIGEADTTP